MAYYKLEYRFIILITYSYFYRPLLIFLIQKIPTTWYLHGLLIAVFSYDRLIEKRSKLFLPDYYGKFYRPQKKGNITPGLCRQATPQVLQMLNGLSLPH